MKMRLARLRVNRLFVKILLCFLSLLIPILIVGFFTYVNFIKELKRDFEEKIMMNVRTSAGTVDSYLQMIHESSISFFNDSSVIRLLKPDKLYSVTERAELEQLARNIARTRVNISSFVDETFVYIDNEKVYTSGGVNDFASFLGKYYRFADYDAYAWEQMMNSVKMIDILHPTDVETPFSRSRVIPFLAFAPLGPYRAVMVTTVPVNTIQRTMDSVFAGPSTRVIVTDDAGRMILNSDPDFANMEAVRVVGEISGTTKQKQGEFAVQGRLYTISAVNTDLYGWSFYAITPIDEFKKQASGILEMVVIICISLIVIGCFFSFVFTYIIYNPIRRIGVVLTGSEEGIRDQGPVVRSDEWERIGSGINRLIENRRRMQDELNVLSLEYAENVLLQLLKGNVPTDEQSGEIQSVLARQLGFVHGDYVCFVISVDFRNEFYDDFQDVERIVIQSKLKKMIGGLLHGSSALYVLEYKPHLYIVVANIGSDEETVVIERKLQQMMQTFRYDALYCRINAGIGKAYAGPEGITRSYRDALTAMLSVGPADHFKIVRAKELHIQYGVQYSFADETRLLALLKTGDIAGVTDAIEKMALELASHNVSFDERNSLLHELYNTGRRFLMERGLKPEQFVTAREREQLVRPGEHPLALEARKGQLIAFFGRIAAFVSKKQSNKSNSLVALIQDYVEDHYTSDLSLEKIADEMEISVKYASRVFKDKLGVNLTDYISRLRVAKAKELLSQTNMSIQDISENVGYFSRTTFLRTFKKLEGVSPQEFRNTTASGRGGNRLIKGSMERTDPEEDEVDHD
ncbi:helix-turn-helix domain-containing protein [Paenibacillus hemerocallicola]|uniref:Helix-turn-helix domain-containing protein n=1 Tax=Paenibacillus hemerocallicola TaxID=1172614 RepID=A0A5C4TDF1_9BACL|nr:helix-turn-helix domain-containing protein [Paenibacillus hemerocallicola]TNJ67031.1 helix-turn-helix domain-containing protein [Paenibacillus hemerocallicola]